MRRSTICLLTLALSLPLLAAGCATDVGTGSDVLTNLKSSYPISVGRLVAAQLGPSRRLKVYVQLCAMRDVSPVQLDCQPDDQRLVAVIESSETKLLRRFAETYLPQGGDMPLYVYGPSCEGLAEMILVPRCQRAMAISAWDPHLQDYVVYSTLYGDSVLESSGFENFVSVTGRITGLVRKASKVVP